MKIFEVENIDFNSFIGEITFKYNFESGFVEGYHNDGKYEITLSPLGDSGWYAEILDDDGTGVAVNLDSTFDVIDHLADM